MSTKNTTLLFLVADGMGGRPDELDGRTCLEAAHTPNMDELAATALVGRCRTVPDSMPPGSDVANMALMGFDPEKYHTGRGPIEAAAQGLRLDPDDLVFRLNLVTVDEFTKKGRMLDYSAGHIGTDEATRLIARLQAGLGGEGFIFMAGIQYRHLLIQPGGADAVEAGLCINPPHDITDKPIGPDLKTLAKSAGLRNLVDRAARILSEGNPGDNPTRANAVWPWGQGRPLTLPNFADTFGLNGAVISAVDLIDGLGMASGMAVIKVEGATGLVDTNYQGKVDAALDFLNSGGDFVFVHLEGPDECGHAGDPSCKVTAIERFDAQIVGPLRRALAGRDVAWLVTCDHFTPIAERTHTKDPVPFLLSHPGCGPSGLRAFTEATADSTGLYLDAGHELLPWVLGRLRG